MYEVSHIDVYGLIWAVSYENGSYAIWAQRISRPDRALAQSGQKLPCQFIRPGNISWLYTGQGHSCADWSETTLMAYWTIPIFTWYDSYVDMPAWNLQFCCSGLLFYLYMHLCVFLFMYHEGCGMFWNHIMFLHWERQYTTFTCVLVIMCTCKLKYRLLVYIDLLHWPAFCTEFCRMKQK